MHSSRDKRVPHNLKSASVGSIITWQGCNIVGKIQAVDDLVNIELGSLGCNSVLPWP